MKSKFFMFFDSKLNKEQFECKNHILSTTRATAMHLPFKSSWLYIGTEKGNTYLLNIYNNFSQSGYDIKWNNVIEL